jgi:hypothetical protein
MKEGDIVFTRRFMHVRISRIYCSREAAADDGYLINASYDREPGFGVAGKIPEPIAHPNRMTFVAYREVLRGNQGDIHGHKKYA